MKHLQWIMLLSHWRKVCSNIPNLWLFVIACWWYTRYSAHTVAGTNYSRECTAGTEVPFSPRNYPLPIIFFSLIMQFFQFVLHFWSDDTFTLNGQTNYANLWITFSLLFFSIFLPLVPSALSSRPVVFPLYLAIVAPGILPKAWKMCPGYNRITCKLNQKHSTYLSEKTFSQNIGSLYFPTPTAPCQ